MRQYAGYTSGAGERRFKESDQKIRTTYRKQEGYSGMYYLRRL
jgi:hypothetical protein